MEHEKKELKRVDGSFGLSIRKGGDMVEGIEAMRAEILEGLKEERIQKKTWAEFIEHCNGQIEEWSLFDQLPEPYLLAVVRLEMRGTPAMYDFVTFRAGRPVSEGRRRTFVRERPEGGIYEWSGKSLDIDPNPRRFESKECREWGYVFGRFRKKEATESAWTEIDGWYYEGLSHLVLHRKDAPDIFDHYEGTLFPTWSAARKYARSLPDYVEKRSRIEAIRAAMEEERKEKEGERTEKSA